MQNLKVLKYKINFHDLPHENVLAITGHMMDGPNRAQPRFPDTVENLVQAKKAIYRILNYLRTISPIDVIYMGGTHGFDRLVLAWAFEYHVQVHQFRPYCERDFYQNAVTGETSPTNSYWTRLWEVEHRRLNKQVFIHEPVINNQPASHQDLKKVYPDDPYACFTDVNFAILNMLELAGQRGRVLAHWDGTGAEDSPGGTRHLISTAMKKGVQAFAFNTGIRNCATQYPEGIQLLK